jgi:CRISPR/Cas system CMR-associated protein Cmr1 (group 7 of RAMP superfamily)
MTSYQTHSGTNNYESESGDHLKTRKKVLYSMEKVKAYERNLLKTVKFILSLTSNYVYIK